MKALSKIVLAIAAVGCCVSATAQSSQSDAERRARNREEAIANHERMQRGETMNTTPMHGDDTRMRHHDGRRMHGDMHSRKEGAKERIKEGARSTENFTHRQLNKVRRFGDRQGAKMGSSPGTRESDKAPTALGK